MLDHADTGATATTTSVLHEKIRQLVLMNPSTEVTPRNTPVLGPLASEFGEQSGIVLEGMAPGLDEMGLLRRTAGEVEEEEEEEGEEGEEGEEEEGEEEYEEIRHAKDQAASDAQDQAAASTSPNSSPTSSTPPSPTGVYDTTHLLHTLCGHLAPGTFRNPLPSPPCDDNTGTITTVRIPERVLESVEREFYATVTALLIESTGELTGEAEAQLREGVNTPAFERDLEEAVGVLEEAEMREMSMSSSFLEDEEEAADSSNSPSQPAPASPTKPSTESTLNVFSLPIVYEQNRTGFEPTKEFSPTPGSIVAGRYMVESELGTAAFSTAYRCMDLTGGEAVCLKIIKNTKDFFDQSLDEIKILQLLNESGDLDVSRCLVMKEYFYFKEHLIIVTELLKLNLYEFESFITESGEPKYFTLPRLAYITYQLLQALSFVHDLNLMHCDVKPENVLLSSYSRAEIKLIDFGSGCFTSDHLSSYIQSRSYRAPEVILGLPYDGKIDIWSVGCVVAEMANAGKVLFENDSVVCMLGRIQAVSGNFPRHMLENGAEAHKFFTPSGLLYSAVGDSSSEEESEEDEEEDGEEEGRGRGRKGDEGEEMVDIVTPIPTPLANQLGHDEVSGMTADDVEFADFVGLLLMVDPSNRPTAKEALKHPFIANTLKRCFEVEDETENGIYYASGADEHGGEEELYASEEEDVEI